MAKQSAESNPQPALIFIPDISGFTRFVSETEISHSQHIIEELLETLINANTLGLEISEIEGDAILFYRFGQAPTAAELLHQVQRMFVDFHAHLKKYETHRICHCGACRSAHELTLKFVTHYGYITQNKIKQYVKLFGKEVIVAHRLLKNDIPHHEYAMFTSPLIKACTTWVEVPTVAWAGVEHGEEEYDSGPVKFCFLPLAPLMDYIPTPKPDDYHLPGKTTEVFRSEAVIDAPMLRVFNIMSDLPWRAKWIVGSMPEVVDLNHQILQEGSTHRCLANGPVVVSHDFTDEENTQSFWETDIKKTFAVRYSMQGLDESRTRVWATAFMPKSLVKELMFRLFMKKSMLRVYQQTWNKLNDYCRQLAQSDTRHPTQLLTAADAATA